MKTPNLLDTVSGTAPSYWASYFINGDASGLEDAEQKQADSFAEWLGGSIVDCEDAGFMRWHDAAQFGVLAADCSTYTALVQLTPVLFRVDRGEVSAIFPTIPASPNGAEMTCYAHIGQHSGCSLDWYRTTRPATADESAALERELASIGYHLKAYKRIQPWMNDARRAELARTK